MDCGFENRKLEGLFCNVDWRRGIMKYRPSDLIWTALIRSRGEIGESRPATVPSVVEAVVGDEELGVMGDSRLTAMVLNRKGTGWKTRLRRAYLAASHGRERVHGGVRLHMTTTVLGFDSGSMA